MKTWTAVLAALLLAGCEPAPTPPPQESDHALEKAVQEPLDRARAVEDQVKAAKDKQAREIEEGGG